jgi:hypothetical protein
MNATGDKVSDHIANVTGGLGFAYNQGRDQNWMDFGYPAASPYDGNAIVVSGSEHRYDVTNPNGTNNLPDPGPGDNSIGSLQTPGFSGGPWILSFGSNTGTDPHTHGNLINSVNSFYYTNPNQFAQEIQGPYFDTSACAFWKGATGFSGSC